MYIAERDIEQVSLITIELLIIILYNNYLEYLRKLYSFFYLNFLLFFIVSNEYKTTDDLPEFIQIEIYFQYDRIQCVNSKRNI